MSSSLYGNKNIKIKRFNNLLNNKFFQIISIYYSNISIATAKLLHIVIA